MRLRLTLLALAILILPLFVLELLFVLLLGQAPQVGNGWDDGQTEQIIRNHHEILSPH